MRATTIGIVNYGAGNLYSLMAALSRQGINHGMIHSSADLERFDRIIIPGVGHAGAAMRKLENTGMIDALKAFKKPLLGICLGMQLLTDYSEEGNQELLKLIPLQTCSFSKVVKLKIPHMGWNRINLKKNSPLFKEIPDQSHFYFIHSYFIEYSPKFTIASCNYGTVFSAAFQKENFYGLQFHPEKSGELGETILRNFSLFN